MKAKEMFEELGYELIDVNECDIRYANKHFITDTEYIVFDKINRNISHFIISDSPFTPSKDLPLNMKELKAINKQIEELGWNE